MEKKIVVYSQPTCVPCTFVKNYLTDKGVEFEVINVVTDEEKEAMKEKTGFQSTPITMCCGKSVVGFNPPELDKLLQCDC